MNIKYIKDTVEQNKFLRIIKNKDIKFLIFAI